MRNDREKPRRRLLLQGIDGDSNDVGERSNHPLCRTTISIPCLVVCVTLSVLLTAFAAYNSTRTLVALRDASFFATPTKVVSSSFEKPNNEKLRIAVLSGFVTRGQTQGGLPLHIPETMIDHMVNKACYCDLWGYDFIFNTTWGFDEDIGNRYWLEYGTWHRVPHMVAALPSYDWILYTDVDFVFQDMSVPLESFVKEWELYGKDVSVFLPTEAPGYFTFSAYVVMIRNSPFGRRLLHNWMEFANGLCTNGNVPGIPGEYKWEDSDQPGIWYALAKTHAEFHGHDYQVRCNETTGTIVTTRAMGPELNQYFNKIGGGVVGHHGEDLHGVPDDQHIIWSKLKESSRYGLGLQQTYGDYADGEYPASFALHIKRPLTGEVKNKVDYCRRVRGCDARHVHNGTTLTLAVGCQHNRTALAAKK